MIINSFDDKSEAKINPDFNENAYELDACILTFSNIIEDYVLKNYNCKKNWRNKRCSRYKIYI